MKRRSTGNPCNLPARELEILRMAAQGLTDVQMAEKIFLSPETIGTYWRRILQRLGARTRTQAVAIEIRARIAEADAEIESLWPIVLDLAYIAAMEVATSAPAGECPRVETHQSNGERVSLIIVEPKKKVKKDPQISRERRITETWRICNQDDRGGPRTKRSALTLSEARPDDRNSRVDPSAEDSGRRNPRQTRRQSLRDDDR